MRILGRILMLALMLCPFAVVAQTGTPGAAPDSTRRNPDVVAVGGGCIRAGDPILVTGRGFGDRPDGEITLVVAGRDHPLRVRSWSERRVRLTQPRDLKLEPGRAYRLRWTEGRRVIAELGQVEVCASGTRRTTVPDNVRKTVDGGPEFIASMPQAATGQATAILQGLGGAVLRTRTLPSLGETMIVVTLPDGLTLGAAQSALTAAVPGAALDFHHLYGFVAGPRVYARKMVSERGAVCPISAPLTIGLIDGPAELAHPALNAAMVKRRAFLPEGARAASVDHGTGVAALIVGAPNAGPLAGFAPGASLRVAEAFWADASGPASAVEWIAGALDWLMGDGVRLINLSFAGPENAVLSRIVGQSARRGAILIAAAGNERKSKVGFPAAAREVIAVTAVDAAQRRYRDANRGGALDFAAPGVDVWSARGKSGGHYATGTSFAVPIVTAVAAHHLAKRPNLAADVIRALLRDGAVDIGSNGRDDDFGWGLVHLPDC